MKKNQIKKKLQSPKKVTKKSTRLNEGDTSRSTKAEQVLSILINNQNEKDFSKFLKSKDANAQFLRDYFDDYIKKGSMEDVYGLAIENIRNLSISPNASQLGANQYITTPIWQEYGGSKTLTSKTDVYADAGYSVKNAKEKVRVLDAAAPQLKALCMSTITDPAIGISTDVQKVVSDSLNNITELARGEGATIKRYIGKSREKASLGDIRKEAEFGTGILDITKSAAKKIIKQYDKNTDEINKEVNDIFQKLSGNQLFKYAFIYESITGEKAFGGSEAVAEYILAWNQDFSEIHKLYMDDVAKQVVSKFQVPKFVAKTSGSRIGKTIQIAFKAAADNEKDRTKSIEQLANIDDTSYEFLQGGFMGESKNKKSGYTLRESLMYSAGITIRKIEMLEKKQKRLVEQRENRIITENWFMDKWSSIKEEGLRYLLSFINTVVAIVKLGIEKIQESIESFMNFFGIYIDVEGSYDEEASITYEELV